MSTEHDKPPEIIIKKPIFDGGEISNPKDNTLAVLEQKVGHLEDRLLEERFLWMLVCIFLIDAYIFTHMTNWAGALVIGILQLIAIVVLADRCQVNIVMPLIDKLTGFAASIRGDGNS